MDCQWNCEKLIKSASIYPLRCGLFPRHSDNRPKWMANTCMESSFVVSPLTGNPKGGEGEQLTGMKDNPARECTLTTQVNRVVLAHLPHGRRMNGRLSALSAFDGRQWPTMAVTGTENWGLIPERAPERWRPHPRTAAGTQTAQYQHW